MTRSIFQLSPPLSMISQSFILSTKDRGWQWWQSPSYFECQSVAQQLSDYTNASQVWVERLLVLLTFRSRVLEEIPSFNAQEVKHPPVCGRLRHSGDPESLSSASLPPQGLAVCHVFPHMAHQPANVDHFMGREVQEDLLQDIHWGCEDLMGHRYVQSTFKHWFGIDVGKGAMHRGVKRAPRAVTRLKCSVLSGWHTTVPLSQGDLQCFQSHLRIPAGASWRAACPTWTSCFRPYPGCELHPSVYIFFSSLGTDPRHETGHRLWSIAQNEYVLLSGSSKKQRSQAMPIAGADKYWQAWTRKSGQSNSSREATSAAKNDRVTAFQTRQSTTRGSDVYFRLLAPLVDIIPIVRDSFIITVGLADTQKRALVFFTG